jgi:SHS family lactate transporter-like MFS transporter
MSLIADLKSLEPSQRSAIWASYLGWTLDAFDYFLLVFMLKAISAEFHTNIEAVSVAIFWTLAARPIGAFLFGWLAEHFGRRPVLMADIILFSIFEFASGFAPSLTSLLILRFLFGIAMGGEWGLGASLVMESIPARLRGPVSGLLQSGYPSGYFVASLVYFLLFDLIGWRGMFMVGVAPAFLVLLIRIHVKESPVFEQRQRKRRARPIAELVGNWKIASARP